ncbi:MAG: hypothetical protein H7249_05560 [Chitinophagaceae bacterium]|nr:hypothetical protein [Oligoflexus sp.]
MTAIIRDVDVTTLIPHRGPMHLIDRINWVDTDVIRGEVRACLRADGPYFTQSVNGEVSEFENHWLIELAAQSSAALYQYSRQGAHKASPKGYLVSIRDFSTSEGLELKARDELLFRIIFEVETSPLGQSRCEVRLGSTLIAHGELTFLLDV